METSFSDNVFIGTVCLFFGLAVCCGLIDFGMWLFKIYIGIRRCKTEARLLSEMKRATPSDS